MKKRSKKKQLRFSERGLADAVALYRIEPADCEACHRIAVGALRINLMLLFYWRMELGDRQRGETWVHEVELDEISPWATRGASVAGRVVWGRELAAERWTETTQRFRLALDADDVTKKRVPYELVVDPLRGHGS